MSEPSKKIQQVKSVGLEIECPFRFYFPEVYS